MLLKHCPAPSAECVAASLRLMHRTLHSPCTEVTCPQTDERGRRFKPCISFSHRIFKTALCSKPQHSVTSGSKLQLPQCLGQQNRGPLRPPWSSLYKARKQKAENTPLHPWILQLFAAIGHKVSQLFILSVLLQFPVLLGCWLTEEQSPVLQLSLPAVIFGHPCLFLWGELRVPARTLIHLCIPARCSLVALKLTAQHAATLLLHSSAMPLQFRSCQDFHYSHAFWGADNFAAWNCKRLKHKNINCHSSSLLNKASSQPKWQILFQFDNTTVS